MNYDKKAMIIELGIHKKRLSRLWMGLNSLEMSQDKLRHEVQKVYAAVGLGFLMTAIIIVVAYKLAVM